VYEQEFSHTLRVIGAKLIQMTAPQLKSRIWADALIRRARLGGAFAYVCHHGDDTAGMVAIKVSHMNGCAVLWLPERDEDYNRIWVAQSAAPQSEEEVDDWIRRTRQHDPDLWVIEIEDKKGRPFLLENERAS
jgi:hypothetical protein